MHTDVILSKISEFDIFKYYCRNFKELHFKFCSELREDNKPSASIVNYNGNLLYKDFGRPADTFNCFGYVQNKFSLTFTDALIKISNDFNLGLAISNGKATYSKPVLYNKHIADKKVTIIKKRRRPWYTKDVLFWMKYGITNKILTIFAVEPIDYYWINENRFSCKSITYAFRFGNKFKIYAPHEKEKKWFSNTTKEIIQGYKQLPAKGDVLYITSSLKDIMSLYAMHMHGIALQSEMQMPSEMQMQMLQKRFKKIIVLYDNDFKSKDNPGQTMAKKICAKYNLVNMSIPTDWEAKDVSDAIVVHGFDKVKQFIYENQEKERESQDKI